VGLASSLLDQLLTRLGDEASNRISGGDNGQSSGDGSDQGGPSGDATATTQVAIKGASCTPTNPKVQEAVSCLVTLGNSANADAAGLSVALLDDQDYLLGDETMVEGVSLARHAQKTVTVALEAHRRWGTTGAGQALRPDLVGDRRRSAGQVTVSASASRRRGANHLTWEWR